SWLSKRTGAVYRLLSEAEWEYACRGGTTSTYCYGDDVNTYQANFAAVVGSTTTVGSFPANPFGLYDMHGNVWEWVEDAWSANYAGALADGGSSTIIDDPNIRVVRGGSWINAAKDLRAACRNASLAFQRSNSVGFRLARDI
ncbi:MAG: formylglycine-generating enzyme family protein, partial [Rhodomicrobium sp.]